MGNLTILALNVIAITIF